MGSTQDEYYKYMQLAISQSQAQAMYGMGSIGQSLSGPVTQMTNAEPNPDQTLLLLEDE